MSPTAQVHKIKYFWMTQR